MRLIVNQHPVAAPCLHEPRARPVARMFTFWAKKIIYGNFAVPGNRCLRPFPYRAPSVGVPVSVAAAKQLPRNKLAPDGLLGPIHIRSGVSRPIRKKTAPAIRRALPQVSERRYEGSGGTASGSLRSGPLRIRSLCYLTQSNDARPCEASPAEQGQRNGSEVQANDRIKYPAQFIQSGGGSRRHARVGREYLPPLRWNRQARRRSMPRLRRDG
ncbi:hypothetical protein J2Z31_005261 [Sinorhizobium kostiense]|uniref:Uncharacterized protein n=1 Tax=Sinorhizobium kostiense TaxID=76747 RepID=A0ABS4R745_9HYPH|nr:hypothetical protein [Sinorhizobium kostiense]